MGEIQNHTFQLPFNASLKIDFQGSRVTSDGGLIVVRELDERLGLGKLIDTLADLFGQSAYSRLVNHARYYWLLLAAMVRRIALLPVPSG